MLEVNRDTSESRPLFYDLTLAGGKHAVLLVLDNAQERVEIEILQTSDSVFTVGHGYGKRTSGTNWCRSYRYIPCLQYGVRFDSPSPTSNHKSWVENQVSDYLNRYLKKDTG